MILLQGFFTYSPVMNRLFQSVPLEADTWFGIAGLAVLSFIVVEIEKQLRFRRRMEQTD
jgi:hypothetical protein